MIQSRHRRIDRIRFVLPLGVVSLCASASAQVTFSVDYRSPTIGPTPITAADILIAPPAYGPLPPPAILFPGGPIGGAGLGLATYGGCAGAPPGGPCPIEMDAHSFGFDFLTPGPIKAGEVLFSVDEFAIGMPGTSVIPSVLTEMPGGDSSADVWANLALPAGPLPPIPFGPGHVGQFDGNGLLSPSANVLPGLGLIEGDLPVAFPLDGDDLDSLDVVEGPLGPGVWFSLDAGFMDPALGLPNLGTAGANGFLPGAILFTAAPGGPPVMYALPFALGLDIVGGPGSDDLDALAMFENGVPGFVPSPAPYAWGPGTAFDMVLFSVRRGSAVVGLPDSIFGIPIAPGDILIPPVVGGGSPFPGIFIAAERLGLATTRALGVATAPFGGDDLDALDVVRQNQTGFSYCHGIPTLCPCGNGGAPGNGCANSLFAVGANLSATGNASVSADTVVLTGTNMPNSACVYIQGTAQTGVPFGDGRRCVSGSVIRLGILFNVGNSSTFPSGALPPVSVAGALPAAGGTRHYQIWYRDAFPFCTPATFNLSNALTISWTP